MMTSTNTYTLYLDEINANGPLNYFCLAGIIVRDDVYKEQLIPEINNLKQRVFGNTNVILHETDIHLARYGTDYHILKHDSRRRNLYWNGVRKLFTNYDFTVVAVAVHERQIGELYPRTRKDKYYIALQVILENYVHFLIKNKATKGAIMAESRGPQDSKLLVHFSSLKKTGTLFYDEHHLREYLTTMSFPKKEENIIGLQIADMIPNPLNRQLSGLEQKKDTGNLIDLILTKAYDGFIDKQNRFGIKIIP